MKRREFLKKATLTTAGAFVAPYILPSGRLFAPTGSQIAPHVVLVMYAGGIRNQETVDQMYLTQSQYSWNPDPSINVPGNIMP
ncbi:MAG: twin-arginine translocation signal domain-containing protein, partial [Flavobacteriales bacterium]